MAKNQKHDNPFVEGTPPADGNRCEHMIYGMYHCGRIRSPGKTVCDVCERDIKDHAWLSDHKSDRKVIRYIDRQKSSSIEES